MKPALQQKNTPPSVTAIKNQRYSNKKQPSVTAIKKPTLQQ